MRRMTCLALLFEQSYVTISDISVQDTSYTASERPSYSLVLDACTLCLRVHCRTMK